MKEQRLPGLLFLLGAILCTANLFLYFSKPLPHLTPPVQQAALISQNTYFGPTNPVPGNPQLVRIEILVKDSPSLAGVQIQKVMFDGQMIPLKPRDIFGKRASASFQLPPGKYILQWIVNRDKTIWPRTLTHTEQVTIDPRDLWVQIVIEGDSVSIR